MFSVGAATFFKRLAVLRASFGLARSGFVRYSLAIPGANIMFHGFILALSYAPIYMNYLNFLIRQFLPAQAGARLPAVVLTEEGISE